MSGQGGAGEPPDQPGFSRGERGDELDWPSRDLDDPPSDPPSEPQSGASGDAGEPDLPDGAAPMPVSGGSQEPAGEKWDTRRWGERRRPTTAEQAVPWLIGLVLALTGMVIVLLALIFTEANGGFAAEASATPSLEPSFATSASPSHSASQRVSASPTASATPAPTPAPTYGSLEVVYLARANGVGVSKLYRDDFATSAAGRIVASSGTDIAHVTVAPDGTVSAAIVDGKLVAFTPGKPARTLESAASAATFAADARTVYAATVTRSGSTDTATINAIGYADGTVRKLTTITFPQPSAPQLSALNTAAFVDDGAAFRLYATSDGNLVFWVSQGGQWRIDPVSGNQVAVSRQPVLWSPDGSRRITVRLSGSRSTISLLDASGATTAAVAVTGVVSHLRWSPKGNRVIFTLGIAPSGGGIRQDLYLWDLGNAKAPVALTANGASFGVEWLGVAQFWQP